MTLFVFARYERPELNGGIFVIIIGLISLIEKSLPKDEVEFQIITSAESKGDKKRIQNYRDAMFSKLGYSSCREVLA